MGKKDKKGKKGKGAEKTALKTEKKADKRSKKELAEKGEDDIEKLLAEFTERDKKLDAVVEEKVPPPSARVNGSLTPHPERDELLMFGGEFFNGLKTFMYNDLLVYHTRTQDWTRVQAPHPPPPRCAHQAVSLAQGGGQLWLFGGEFASPTQSQFYHYKDLWCFHLRERRWEQVKAPGGPSARSGHRMAAFRRQLLVFGGFHDNVRDYKYYNDVHAFNLDTFTWCEIVPSGAGPSERSGCQMAAPQSQGGLLVYGGYSKARVKKDVDLGKTHTDMFLLCPDSKCKDEAAPAKWKWQSVKQHGVRPSPRCGFSMVAVPGNRAVLFGGVYDEEEDEESVHGAFYNELYSLELDKGTWHEVELRGKKDATNKRKRRRKKEERGAGEEAEEDQSDGEEEEGVEEELEELNVEQEAPTTSLGSVFSMTVGPQTDACAAAAASGAAPVAEFTPSARMNSSLAVKAGVLYLYGGMVEQGDRQITHADFYCLDLHKLDAWTILVSDQQAPEVYQDSESGSDVDSEEERSSLKKKIKTSHPPGSDEEDSMDDDEDEDDDDDDGPEEVPEIVPGESVTDYFSRCRDYWMDRADEVAEANGLEPSTKQLKKAALKMAEEHFASR